MSEGGSGEIGIVVSDAVEVNALLVDDPGEIETADIRKQ